MLILGTTTDKIQVTLSSAITTNQLDCIATYKDITTSAYSGSAPILVTTNNTTAVDLVPAPASNTQRIVDFISIYNNDTANATVTVRINRNNSIGILFKCTLITSESLVYSEGAGWNIHSNNGSPKQFLSLDSAVTTAQIVDLAVTNAKIANSSITPSKLAQPFSQGTLATTSGTFVDFTGIPSWVKRITVMFSGVSTNGTSTWLVQLGAGSVQTTGYVSYPIYVNAGASSNAGGSTAGIVIASTQASNTAYGAVSFALLGSNIWVANGNFTLTSTTGVTASGGVTLSGTLDRVRLTTTSGTDTFDAGSVNITWE